MKVLILAAGYGTRLYPLITNTPKPLLEIAGQPLVNHLVDKMAKLPGLKEIIVVTNAKFYDHFIQWGKNLKPAPAPVAVVNDGTDSPDNRLGSVGDLKFALDHHPVNDDLLILGGDNLFDASLNEFHDFARKREPHVTIGLYDIGQKEEATAFGVVAVDGEGRVTSFEEKPEKPRSSLIAMCCYYIPKTALRTVAEYLAQTKKADKAGDYIRWLSENKKVYGFKFRGKWYDIGSIESYHEAQASFSK